MAQRIAVPAALMAALVVALLWLKPVTRREPIDVQVEVGDYIRRPDGLPWCNRGARAIIMVTNSTCPICAQAQSFEEALYGRARDLDLPFIYIVSENARHDEYARALKKSGRAVLRDNLFQLGLARVPAFLAVRRDGFILATWSGSVPSRRREAILGELLSGESKPLYGRIDHTELRYRIHRNPRHQIVALREPKAMLSHGFFHYVIPANELVPRAKYELEPGVLTFVDCETARSPLECQEALYTLAAVYEFKQLFAVNLPRRQSQDGT